MERRDDRTVIIHVDVDRETIDERVNAKDDLTAGGDWHGYLEHGVRREV